MTKSNLPVILLKSLVLLPYQEVRVEIRSEISKKVMEISKLYHNSEVLVVCPINNLEENPDTNDLPKIGVIGKINSVIDLPNGTARVIISGIERVKIISYVNYTNEDEILDSIITNIEEENDEIEQIAYSRKLINSLDDYINKNPFVTNSIMSQLKGNLPLSKITDLIGNFLDLSFEKKLSLMLETSPIERSKILINELAIESAIFDLDNQIETQLKNNFDNEQKEYLLKEKLKIIKNELGDYTSRDEDIFLLKERIESANFPEKVKNKLEREVKRYSACSEMSPDASIIRNYIEYLFEVPWDTQTKDETDLLKIEKKLSSTHYGMKEAKERIIEYIAVKGLNPDINSPILCLVGPPGVGKTTFAQSVAQAVNRKFVKISLGGMSDSTELVGHQRAYIGSNPGKIVSSLIKCGSNNPVFLLDEVDKLKKDYKGDPASTLLDILDISQNKRFTDNYIDEEVDLSHVLFILTANDIQSIPHALFDRLELINISGYTENEKLFICENYIIPNMLKQDGLKNNAIKFDKEALVKIINSYTNEAGVRELERCLDKIVRKVITEHLKESKRIVSVRIKESDLPHYLDKELNDSNVLKDIKHTGVIHALACSDGSGTILDIEASMYKGKGNYTFTGSLGDVIKESISVAISYLKSNMEYFDIPSNFFDTHDLHIHFTDSAVSKDGPSAGCAIITAILSLIKGVKIPNNVSMSGEISLKGDILKVGGIKEKSISAKRNNIKKFYIPIDNISDTTSLDEDIKSSIKIIGVSNYKDIYKEIFK